MPDRPILRLRFVRNLLSREIEREEALRASDRRRVVRLQKLRLAIEDRIARSGAPRTAPA